MNQAFQIRPSPIYQRQKPVRDEAYKRFVRRFACIGCGRTWRIAAMHTGPHGTSQKASDMTTLPGCPKCHEAFDSDPRGFAAEHRLDIPTLIRKFNNSWKLKQERNANG